MSDESDGPAEPNHPPGRASREDQVVNLIERALRVIELAAAALFVVLFAIGVGDLALRIVRAAMSGRITQPNVVIGFIDTGLLLFIIVEVYETVVAYTLIILGLAALLLVERRLTPSEGVLEYSSGGTER